MGTRVETPSRTIGGSRGRAGTAKGQTGESEEILEWPQGARGGAARRRRPRGAGRGCHLFSRPMRRSGPTPVRRPWIAWEMAFPSFHSFPLTPHLVCVNVTFT